MELTAPEFQKSSTAPSPAPASPAVLKARDVREHLLALGKAWVNMQRTTDTFKFGDPDTIVRGIAVAWMPYMQFIQRAIELECNMLVVHEPLFYTDQFEQDSEVIFKFEGAQAKRALLEKAGIVVYRCHDVWDKMPEIGVTDTWARVLGFSNPIGGEGYYRVFDGGGRTAEEIARDVAQHTKKLEQPGVQLLGRGDRPVHRVAIGCGAITPFLYFVSKLDADLAICADDGFGDDSRNLPWKPLSDGGFPVYDFHLRDGAMAVDLDVPVILVNHGVAEIEGIRNLAEHLRTAFPSVKVEYVPQTCMYRLVTA